MSGNLFEEYVNELSEAGLTPEAVEYRHNYASLMSFVTEALTPPVWCRVCKRCGVIFSTGSWRAEQCPDCGGDDDGN